MSLKIEKKQNNALKIFLIVFAAGVLSRLLIFGAGVFLIKVFDPGRGIFAHISQAGDVVHYAYIAEHGYQAAGETANNIVFYPLYPMLIALFRIVFRNYVLAGLVISYASYGAAAAYLYKLMRLDYDTGKALDALLLLFIAPYGLFFSSAHTEGLFLMLTVMTLYYARLENWAAAGIAGFLAALTKTQGMLLFAPVVYEIILCTIRDRRFKRSSLISLLIPMGFAAYLVLNRVIQGDFFSFVAHQAAAPYYNKAAWISDSLSTSYGVGIKNFSLSMILYWPQISLFFAACLLIFAGLYKKVRTSYLVFFGVYLMLTYFQGWMLSGSRYVSSCAVVYIIMASIDNKFVKYLFYLGGGLLCLFFMVLWLRGYAIM